MVSELRNWGWNLLIGTILLLLPATGQVSTLEAQPTNTPPSPAEALRIYEGAANAQNQKAYD